MGKRDRLPAPGSGATAEHLLELAELRRLQQALQADKDELLESQRLLEEARDNYAELYDWAPIAQLTLGRRGNIRSANLATAELLQRERSWLIGRSFSDLVDEVDRAHLAACLGAGDHKECLIHLLLPSNSLVPVQLTRRLSLRREGMLHVTLLDVRVEARYLTHVQHLNDEVTASVRRRVLLVEDDVDTAETMQHLLEGKGYGVTTAGSVEAAASVDLARVDAIVSDIRLPDGLGTDLLRLLKKQRDLPAIAFSALTKPCDVENATRAGFDVYLTKPIDFSRLLGALGTLLAAPRPAPTLQVQR